MVLASEGQVRSSMRMLSVLSRLPGRDRLMGLMMRPLHRAANAIELPAY